MIGRADFFAPGDWNAVCSLCGRKRKASTMVQNWQGLYRCLEHNEPRHPQDFVRGVQDVQSVPWSQPVNNTFATFCTPNGRTGIIGYAVAGCWIIGYTDPLFDPTITL